MLIGYARVSTADQNPDHQIDALLRAGVDPDHIHVDTASGAKASCPKLDLVPVTGGRLRRWCGPCRSWRRVGSGATPRVRFPGAWPCGGPSSRP